MFLIVPKPAGLSLLPTDLGSGAQWQAYGVVPQSVLRACGDSHPVSPQQLPSDTSTGPRGAVGGPAVIPPAPRTLCAPAGGDGRAEGPALPPGEGEEGPGAEAEHARSPGTGLPGPHRAPEV